uniref:Uncharacterized protein n=1 Tax=Anguilla anguilla TaxID=7936 RepID=A0A0E9PXR1_ANGAN
MKVQSQPFPPTVTFTEGDTVGCHQ